MYAAHAVQVEVDPKPDASKSHDWRRPRTRPSHQPVNCLQQIEGGAVHAIGTTLMEELIVDSQGHMVNPNFHDYHIPTAMDAPEILASFVEAPHRKAPMAPRDGGDRDHVGAAGDRQRHRRPVGVRIRGSSHPI